MFVDAVAVRSSPHCALNILWMNLLCIM